MATILDIGILEYFTPVFVFFFVFALLYAILDKTNLLESKVLKSSISFFLAILFILTSDLMKLVSILTPWVTILFVAVFFIVLFFLFVGVKGDVIAAQFADRTTVWIILLVLMGIFGYAMTQVYGEDVHTIYGEEQPVDESGLNESIGKIIFHPKILGVVLLLVMAGLMIRFLVGGPDK